MLILTNVLILVMALGPFFLQFFLVQNVDFGKYVIISGWNNRYSTIDRDKFLVLGERLTERLNNLTLTAEAKYPINVTGTLV